MSLKSRSFLSFWLHQWHSHFKEIWGYHKMYVRLYLQVILFLLCVFVFAKTKIDMWKVKVRNKIVFIHIQFLLLGNTKLQSKVTFFREFKSGVNVHGLLTVYDAGQRSRPLCQKYVVCLERSYHGCTNKQDKSYIHNKHCDRFLGIIMFPSHASKTVLILSKLFQYINWVLSLFNGLI